ncbi:hypothetical protein XELAEV_18023922mg [Xenopus laevis]|uniref:Uncharacterized protein n=1 Tax=Xenopus laevis TaxID=8355 RepID=A0A974D7H3_XENLA|nr:hypothetical protein XELAEV_18023922mg [Xenopus laevis]
MQRSVASGLELEEMGSRKMKNGSGLRPDLQPFSDNGRKKNNVKHSKKCRTERPQNRILLSDSWQIECG